MSGSDWSVQGQIPDARHRVVSYLGASGTNPGPSWHAETTEIAQFCEDEWRAFPTLAGYFGDPHSHERLAGQLRRLPSAWC